AMVGTPTDRGYWLVAADGGVFAFGDAGFHGSTGRIRLNRPIVGMAPTPSGLGYWLVATDGGVFAFGDAAFQGSTGGIRLRSPIVAMTSTPTGRGYWLVAADGGVFAFGDAGFHGSSGAIQLNSPIVAMAPTESAKGYWLVAGDGGVFAFGDAGFIGSAVNSAAGRQVIGFLANPASNTYAVVTSDGSVLPLGGGEPPVDPAAPTTTTVPQPTTTTTVPQVTTTTTAPAPTTTTTTAAPTPTPVPSTPPFAGPGTVGPAADIPGVHAPAPLRRHEGNFVTTSDGQRIDGLEITGRLVVNHRNVTATNFKARGVSVASSTNRSASVALSWCSVGDRAGATDAYNGIGVGNFTVHRCEVFGTVDLVKLSHGYGELTESWLHDPVQWAVDSQQGGGPSHTDMFQTALVGNVSRLVIRDNRFDAWVFRQPDLAGATVDNLDAAYTATGHVSMFRHTTNWTIDGATVTGNRFDGDVARCVYAIHDADDAPTKATITDNVFVRRYPLACKSQSLSATTPAAIVWARNVDEGGAAVTAPGTASA
ncbi:MAG TPA: hypothetical protein VM264_02830, partial [Acidimicrobiales bacterium]|nr:hypothetical protein [Acidimicrobiales bacterium]